MDVEVKHRIEAAVMDAEDAFWQALSSRLPEVKSGDFPPSALVTFHKATMAAATAWYQGNTGPVEGGRG